MFKIGDWVFDREYNKTVKIIGNNDLWGYKSYIVFEPEEQISYFVLEDKLCSVDAGSDFSIHILKILLYLPGSIMNWQMVYCRRLVAI